MWKSKVFFGMIFSLVASLSAHAATTGNFFDRVIVVPFENTNYSDAIQQSFFLQLAQSGTNFTNFNAEAHPSQGNYVALTSGGLNGVHGDGTVDLNVSNIADLLEAHELTWKVYAEDYPGNCFTGSSSGGYARKHNPFISYLNIQKNPQRCTNIVSADEFQRDVENGALPNYAFYIPNIQNDGHDTGVSFANSWYQQTFSTIVNNPALMNGTLLVTTFDESASYLGNHIYTSLSGPMVKAQTVIADSCNHYSILRLIEDNWNLGTLGRNDSSAQPLPNIWK